MEVGTIDSTYVQLEKLRPDQVAERWLEAPVAYVPIGCIEHHGPHLPLGVDGFTAHAICVDAAMKGGGVVHPISYLANGCLDLPYTITYPAEVVEAWARSVIVELHRRGAKLVVLLTGHGPLDLIHMLKRVCAEFQDRSARAYGLCYLELTAAQLTEPVLGEPIVIDHASTVETSWILAHHPELVDLSKLPNHRERKIVGVYGQNPRFTATAERGRTQRSQCSDLLAERTRAILNGDWDDTMSDLEKFIDFTWSEPLLLDIATEASGSTKAALVNTGLASRYITALNRVAVDGHAVDLDQVTLRNPSAGETGRTYCAGELDREHGLYVRRGQALEVSLPVLALTAATVSLEVTVELGGVRQQSLAWHRSP